MSDLQRELMKVQFEEFPSTVIVTKEKLQSFHDSRTSQSIEDLEKFHENVLFYYLDLPSFDYVCNGVRWGKGASEYTSLPTFKREKLND